jgi:hypothetical protein
MSEANHAGMMNFQLQLTSAAPIYLPPADGRCAHFNTKAADGMPE